MLLTEEEANQKWCLQAEGSKIRYKGMCDCRCDASSCMAWRWSSQWGEHTRKGYCGLAGKPEDVETE
jgi:hypothetical protein